MELGNVVARRAFPQALARLLLGPLANLVVELVVVTTEAEIHFPVPVKVVLWAGLGEPLHSKVGTSVDRVDGSFSVVVNVVWEWLRVVHAHLLLRPQGCHAPELLGQVVLDDLLVNLLRRPNGQAVVLDVEQEVNIVLASRLEGKFVDHGSQGEDLVVAVLVAGPGAENVSVARHLLLCGCRLVCLVVLEAVSILFAAALHGRSPVDLAVVNLLLPAPDLVGTSLLRLAVHFKTALVARVGVAVGAEAAEAIKALLVVETDFLVGAKEGSSHVLGNTGVGVDVGQVDLLLLVEVARLDLVVILEVLGRVELVRVKRYRVHWRLLVFLGHVWPLWLDIVLGIWALRVLDIVLFGHPVAKGDESANAVEEAIKAKRSAGS